ncbi:polyamine ABC transporter ATP-binding protein [Oceanospirillaceae bacterium]|jgi:putrescine transport system ATP-binding protein|uniref:ABC transporter ATP-binding protein n=1 Tax=Candidatus Njordibacter sp. Uisw_002 TaxID=3230971 RepID=UPI00233375EC|nr:polyamine ABC transporter ATP-binding protein [Oceanospirillaceae bacterium]MDB9958512.1 polyamine ABC transporter ATP-binding protein [Oceanospirillaceae bacterium]MDB9972733.1 polyamine ABC transporter ATP-binding protein [Oceanospirillaceae bacterium]|tara:strand:+ start:2682 stop:3785 length:1104 start_codon:yes stop_codon:yes gene_type:complete
MTQDSQPMLEIRQVSKNFGGLTAVKEVNLSINKGEIFALLGGSGCGKTTLLRMLAGFEIPSAGAIFIDGEDISQIPPHKRPVNMMFQSYALFPHMSVAQNVAFGLKQEKNKLSKPEIAKKVLELLTLVRMQDFAQRKPDQLSGGQRQRVALARSLAKKPKVLLLDEPMGALDKKLRSQMQLEVVDIIESVGVTCVMVTHDQEEAMTMANRISVMHDGEIMQVGTPSEIYEFPNSRHTAEFIGSVNIFDATVTQLEADYTRLSCADLHVPIQVEAGVNAPLGSSLGIAVRPEKITMSQEKPELTDNWLTGMVEDIAYLGGHSVYYVKLASGKRVMTIGTNNDRHEQKVTWEDTVYLYWSITSAVVLYR